MANQLKVELNIEGVRSLLKSSEMKSICEEHAHTIMNRAGSGYKVSSYVGTDRVNASVTTSTYQAKADNMRNHTLIKAVSG